MEYPIAVNSTSRVVHAWVLEPDGRGTWGILWPCIAVLILNTWTVLHLNVPPNNRNGWRNLMHKCKWWIICAVVPDGICVNAFAQWRSSHSSLPRFKSLYKWWTIRHSFYCEMGGYRVTDEATGLTYLFRGDELHYLANKNIIQLPEIGEDDIKDRSNADSLVKGFAILQSSWFLLQTVMRIVQKLPLTTLELATISLIAYTWLSYFFWWHKPMDLETYTVVTIPNITVDQLCELAKATSFRSGTTEWYLPPPRYFHQTHWDYFWWERPFRFKEFASVNPDNKVPPQLRRVVESSFTAFTRVTDWYSPFVNESHSSQWGRTEHFLVWIIGELFNGLHLAAWSFTFPSNVERWTWRIAVLVMCGVTTLWLPVAAALLWLPKTSFAKNLVYWLITLLYFLTRLYLIVEIFVGLRSLEPRVFLTVNWTKYWPHV